MTEARVTGTGHWPEADDPAWYVVNEPTAEQVNDAIAVAEHKVFIREGDSIVYPGQYGGMAMSSPGWNWLLKLNKRVSWIDTNTRNVHADEIDPDAGRHVKKNERLPGRWDRVLMKKHGEEALHRFIDDATAPDTHRAEYYEDITGVRVAIEYGDLPAAVHAALNCDLRLDIKNRLVKELEKELIYWPDFQREDSTSAKDTIAHWVPSVQNSSVTISAT